MRTYPADDGVVVGEVGLAVLAAVDLVGVQVDVVGQPHRCAGWALGLRCFAFGILCARLSCDPPAGQSSYAEAF